MHRTFLALLLLLFSNPSLAWSKQGHQLVGELAERELTPVARSQVQRLLQAEPDPTLAGVAVWADDIRAQGGELGRRSARWHYVNFPRDGGCQYAPARDCPDGQCVIGAIGAQARILADTRRPDAERAEALKFLVHLVGDAHQPMHAGFPDDRGGNGFQLNYRGRGAPGGDGSNLHAIWDYWLVESAGLDNAAYTAYLLTLPVAADAAPASDNPPADWARESCRLIESQAIYPPRRRITDAYLDLHRPLAEQRLRLAGTRLAALINAALDPAP
jgi:hypothetical protein